MLVCLPLSTPRLLQDMLAYAQTHNYPLEHVPHQTLTLGTSSFEDNLATATGLVDQLLVQAQATRQPAPLASLAFAQQCGGSDAFSGISANPLAG
jgi:altronate dehydratase